MWLAFSIFLLFALGLDLALLKQKARKAGKLNAALFWTSVWVLVAIIFGGILWLYVRETSGTTLAHTVTLQYFTGYLIEKSLSIDNLFAFYVVFHALKLDPVAEQRVFAYGVISAIVMRLLFILLGTWLIVKFHWLLYIMGGFLVIMGVYMLVTAHKHQEEAQEKTNRLLVILKKYLPVDENIKANHFFIWKNNRYLFTPLFIALILIEINDLIFAVDSIPAIFAITTDPFIVWTSNVFAILGLRALYFVMEALLLKFNGLSYGIAIILMFIGTKMLIAPWVQVPVILSLLVIVGVLALTIIFSLYFKRRKDKSEYDRNDEI